MDCSNYLILLCLFVVIYSQKLSAETSFRPSALVLPVTKDSATGQHVTEIKQRTPLIPIRLTIDLGGEVLWVDCYQRYVSSSFKPSLCGSAACSLANQRWCSSCETEQKPGCINHSCGLTVANTFGNFYSSGEVAQDVVALQSTDGSNPGRVVYAPNLLFSCSTLFRIEGLASGAVGVAALGKAKIGLPSQLASAFSFKRKFAICLGSTSSKGVLFFGDGPYNFLPNHDLSSGLTYVPLLSNPVGSYFDGKPSIEYFIGVKSIRVNNADIPVNTTLLKITNDGFGGTKISTSTRYMTLEPSIFKAVINAFVKAVSNVRRVTEVAPFSVCYNAKDFSSTRLGLNVPLIELVLQSSKVSWSIFGANSMVDVGNGIVCLGILEAEVNSRPAIVIGAHQIEDNLLQFDLATSRIGFSNLLFGQQTTCGNFNFTSVA